VPTGVWTAGQNLRYDGTAIVTAAGGGDVVGPASSVDNHIALYNGATGKLLKDTSPIVVAAGVVTAVTSVNGVVVEAHAARHNPAGADPMFPGTWAADDSPHWTGAVWVQKFHARRRLAATQTTVSTAGPTVKIVLITVTLPRVGTYMFRFGGRYTSGSAAAMTMGLGYEYTGTPGAFQQGNIANNTATTAGGGGGTAVNVAVGSMPLAATTAAAFTGTVQSEGSFVVSTVGDFSVSFNKLSGASLGGNTYAMLLGSFFEVWEL
jgi:hypothetical protein